MSYDFILLHREPGQSWDEVLEANERLVMEGADRPFSSSARARAKRIADHLQAHDPQLERFTTEHHIELTRPDDAGVQVSLFERELAVTVAYWHTGRAARAVMDLVWSYLPISPFWNRRRTGRSTIRSLAAAWTGLATWTRSAAGMRTCPPGFRLDSPHLKQSRTARMSPDERAASRAASRA